MRHLVLYKLAGFCQGDEVPLSQKTRGAMRNTVFLKSAIFDTFLQNFAKKMQENAIFSHFFAFFAQKKFVGVRPFFSNFFREKFPIFRRPTRGFLEKLRNYFFSQKKFSEFFFEKNIFRKNFLKFFLNEYKKNFFIIIFFIFRLKFLFL